MGRINAPIFEPVVQIQLETVVKPLVATSEELLLSCIGRYVSRLGARLCHMYDIELHYYADLRNAFFCACFANV